MYVCGLCSMGTATGLPRGSGVVRTVKTSETNRSSNWFAVTGISYTNVDKLLNANHGVKTENNSMNSSRKVTSFVRFIFFSFVLLTNFYT